MNQATNEEDTLTKFWSDIQNVKSATVEDIQSDILAYLEQMRIYKSKVEEMQKALRFYAHLSNYEWIEENFEENGVIVETAYRTNVMEDNGERARQALKGVNP